MRRVLLKSMVVALVAMLAVLGAASSATAAAPGMTVSVDGVHLAARGVVTVDLTVACQPPKTGRYLTSEFDYPFVAVDAHQVVGNRVAHLETGRTFDAATICDGRPHAMTVTGAAEPGGRAFKVGRIAVNATADASYAWWDIRTDEGAYVEQFDESGWTFARIHR